MNENYIAGETSIALVLLKGPASKHVINTINSLQVLATFALL